MSQGAWHLCPLLVTSFQLTRTGTVPQVPMCAREKKQVTVGDSPLAPAPSSLQPASASVMKRGPLDFSLSSGSLLSVVLNHADGRSFDSCLLGTQTLPPTHVSCHCCFSILRSLTPISHENHVYFWKLSGEACLTCHGSLSWP